MTDDDQIHEDEHPPESDEGEQANGESESPLPTSTRRRKRALQKTAREDLAKIWAARGIDFELPITYTVSGERIGHDKGDGEAIGIALQRISQFLKSLGGNQSFTNVAWGNSVTFEFAPRSAELEASNAHVDVTSGEPLAVPTAIDESDPESEEDAVPTLQVAAALAAELIALNSTQAAETAANLGSEVAQSYRSLANVLSKRQLTLKADDPRGSEPAVIGPTKAKRISEALRDVTEPKVSTVSAFGSLSIADATQQGFGLRLDPTLPKPPELRRKSLVRGLYTPEAGEKIRDDGLWGKDVVATLEVTRDAVISSSTIRPPKYTLVDVRSRA